MQIAHLAGQDGAFDARMVIGNARQVRPERKVTSDLQVWMVLRMCCQPCKQLEHHGAS